MHVKIEIEQEETHIDDACCPSLVFWSAATLIIFGWQNIGMELDKKLALKELFKRQFLGMNYAY